MKKFLVGMMAGMLILGLVACTKTADNGSGAEPTTLGGKLAASFALQIEDTGDINVVAEKLAEESGFDCMVVPANEGYLNGFSEEVSGFSTGVQFSPMIGSIPFVGYIFEADDAAGLKENLLSLADPGWNICTRAEETVCEISGNYVFFVMCPGEDEL